MIPNDWARLMVFQTVAEEGTITAAAEALQLGHATISRHIEDLEHSLGLELFRRSTKGMEITDTGRHVLRSVQNMSDSAHAITANIRAMVATKRPQVSIAAPEGIAAWWLAPRLPEFHRANPGIEIGLIVLPDAPDVAKGDADISIQFDEPKSPNVIMRPLGWIHYIFWAAPGYLALHGVPTDRFDLGHHRMLHFTSYRKQQELWGEKIPAWQEIMPWIVRTNSGTALYQTCIADGGIASLPSYALSFEKHLRPLPHLGVLASPKIWLTYGEHVREGPSFSPVLEWLRDCFDPAKHPWFRETFVGPQFIG